MVAPVRGSEAIARILQREGTEFLFCFPAHGVIDACAALGVRPMVYTSKSSANRLITACEPRTSSSLANYQPTEPCSIAVEHPRVAVTIANSVSLDSAATPRPAGPSPDQRVGWNAGRSVGADVSRTG